MLQERKSGVLLFIFFFAAAVFFPVSAGGENGIKILVTNDVHGNIYGDAGAGRIGYALLRGYADALEHDGWDVYLADAGDAFSGNAVAQSDSGKSVARLMAKAGYSVLNPGNHAFDYNQSEKNETYYTDVLLPLTGAEGVSSNILFGGEALPGVRREAVVLHDDGEARVAVAGVTTPYVAGMSNRRGVARYDFGLVTGADGEPDHAATKDRVLGDIARAVAGYDRPGDVVVLLSHLGGDDSEDYAHGEITGRDAALVPNVDFVVDSHSHNLVEPLVIGSAQYGIAQRYMTHVAEITLPAGGGGAGELKILPYAALAGYPASEEILAETRAIADRLGMGDGVFELGTEVDLSDAGISEASTPLGRFISRSMVEITGADFALFNAGGIRSGLAPGRVTVGDLYDMVPFQNSLQTFRLTGRDVLDLFTSVPAAKSNAFPQFYGVTAYAWKDGEGGHSVAGVMDADGRAIDPDAEYVFATISFLAEGGDGYRFPSEEMIEDYGDFFTRFARHVREEGLRDAEALNGNDGLLVFSGRESAEAAFAADVLPVEEDGGVLFGDVAERFREHCVRVFIRAQAREGEDPEVGDFAEDIRNDRSTPVGGYWWDERHVVAHDPVLQDGFIRSIEIELPGGGARYPARVAGRFVHSDAMLLEVLPGADGSLPEAHPLSFVDGRVDEAQVLAYGVENGEWRLTLESAGLGVSRVTDGGVETADIAAQGIFINSDGEPVGLAFGDSLVLDGDVPAWLGTETPDAPVLRVEEEGSLREGLRAALDGSVLEVTLRLRLSVEDEEDDDEALRVLEDLIPDGGAALRAPGIVVGRDVLLVPVALPRGGVARIDAIGVTLADGREIPARFVGAFREYQALLIGVDGALPFERAPEGFSLLNPLLPQEAAGDFPYVLPEGQLIERMRVDYALGRRRVRADHDRWAGSFPGYRGDPVVKTRTNEEDGALAFDCGGRLVALALAPRLPEQGEEGRGTTAASAFRPVDFLSRALRAEDAFDASLRPVGADRGERLIDLGVEFQPLDPNTARLFDAVRETRAGDIGLLVTHVYPGTMAAEAGLREHDVLLRAFVEGRGDPVDLRSEAQLFGGGEYEPDMSAETFGSLVRFMPPPWTTRENVLSRLLTGAGAGRRVALEFLRGGEARRAEFETAFFAPDYRSARREKFAGLGLSVKPLTYEAARFFGKPAGADGVGTGVVVSRVEEGGKSAVAGLHRYLLVTRVDGLPVAGMEDFAARVGAFERGEAASVELTVENFGKTRLVKIE